MTRARPEFEAAIFEDLAWLGLEWDEVPAQSTRLASYEAAAQRLLDRGLLYPCTCTRSEIEAAGALEGSDGLIYPGTCKHRAPDPARPSAWRLDADKALAEGLQEQFGLEAEQYLGEQLHGTYSDAEVMALGLYTNGEY